MERIAINIFLTLLIFNPLESMILFLVALQNKVFNKNIIIHLYILGFINFIFQYFAKYMLPASLFNLIFRYLYCFLISGIILYFYIKYFIDSEIKLGKCLFSSIYNSITILLVIIIFSEIFNEIILETNIFEEIMTNFIIKILQFSPFIIFRRYKYEKNFKEI